MLAVCLLASANPPPLPHRVCCTAGIEKYGESWQQVAEHVGGKSAMQCVARFLQLPTEEALLADASPDPHTLGLVRAGGLGGWLAGWVAGWRSSCRLFLVVVWAGGLCCLNLAAPLLALFPPGGHPASGAGRRAGRGICGAGGRPPLC